MCSPTATDTSRDKRYTLRAPCRKCPFRTDVEPYLRTDRAIEIAESLREGAEFPCHKTTVRAQAENGDDTLVDDPTVSRVCAGALATMERGGEPNQMMRVAERIGMYDPAALDAEHQPVHPNLDEWVHAHAVANGDIPTVTTDEGEIIEFEHCGVVADDCEDPAGYGGYGGAVANLDTPTCNPLEDECAGCGRVTCVACRSDEWGEPGDQWCVVCINDEEDDDDESEG